MFCIVTSVSSSFPFPPPHAFKIHISSFYVVNFVCFVFYGSINSTSTPCLKMQPIYIFFCLHQVKHKSFSHICGFLLFFFFLFFNPCRVFEINVNHCPPRVLLWAVFKYIEKSYPKIIGVGIIMLSKFS